MRWPLGIALFALSFGAVAHLVATAAPDPANEELSAKIAWFAAHRDEFDLLIFGSSRTWRGVAPELLDRELARLGVLAGGAPVRSCNLAMAAMEAHEIDAVLRRVLALGPRRARWVLIEVEDWSGRLAGENELKRRTVQWHDLAETRSVLRTIALADLPFRTRLNQGWVHLLHGAAHLTGAGQGPALVRHGLGGERPAGADLERIGRNRGWEPVGVEKGLRGTRDSRRVAFLRDPARYASRVASLGRRGLRAPRLDRYPVAAVREQVAAVRRAGVEPLYFIPPTLQVFPEVMALAADGTLPWLAAFNDAVAYPQLYAVEVRWDADHLARPGAEAFTRELAARLAGRLRQSPPR